MSWFSNHYEKVLLGTGAVFAIGVAYLGWSRISAIDEDFKGTLTGRGNNATKVEGAEMPAKAMQSMKLDHSVKRPIHEGRSVDLFTGVPLFVKRTEITRAIDLLEPSSAEVHAGITNAFWIDNRLDPGFADAPQRDPDGDGFSNNEEFKGKTNPTDASSHPPLIAKLRYIKDQTLTWRLSPSFLDADGACPFNYEDSLRRRNRAAPADPVKPGAVFFLEEPMKGRFKLLGHVVEKQVNQAINVEVETTYVQVEDQRPNKAKTIYKIPAPLPPARADQFKFYDRSAVLTLEAIGQTGKEVVIDENTAFALPFGEGEKVYLLKEVTPEAIVIEYPGADGARIPVRIPKGALPQL